LTESSSLSVSLSKEKVLLKELSALVDREASGISLGVDSASNLVKHLEGKLRDKGKTAEDRQRKIAQLEGDVAEQEKRKSQLESTISEKNSSAEQLSSKLEDLRQAMTGKKNDVTSTTNELVDFEGSISEKKRQTEKLRQDLQAMEKKHQFEIDSLRKSHEEATANSSLMEAQHKALRLLVREKTIALPELKIIEILESQPSSNIEHLQRMTQSRRDEIDTTIRSLVRRGVLSYDSTSGEVKVLHPLGI
jgi:chromosome segregation ATPase